MRVNTDSICLKCEHFWHECGDNMQQDVYECHETCNSPDEGIQQNFEDNYEIIECKGFIKG
ncbi:hypothetical protein PIL02S_03385 [Paenibacillus illinoisensis]|uniref:Uncharacterized protein n=1 Tax=Paenibacillus illinoisensis TaxID=59845 RepID=A0A2W0CC24_9BACL|nr:hypothetical protein PIL02S_03385 [Paenibacillus illinoisensis]